MDRYYSFFSKVTKYGLLFYWGTAIAILVDTLSIPSTIIKLLEAAAADFSLIVKASDSVADLAT